MFILLLKGLAVGLAIAAPVGPIGILCIHRSLNDGFKRGFATGCGAAVADGIYGCIAAFGLTYISEFLANQYLWIRGVGGVFLLFLGIKDLLSKPAEKDPINSETPDLWHAFLTTFFLTLTNPMTILAFVAIFAGLGLGSIDNTLMEATVLVAGIILGSLLWWLLLSSGASFFRNRMSRKIFRGINIASGVMITVFGVMALLSIF
ncbi:MAG: LysE family transporter [Proteobacteria bacterium]|nr:LysE family transporter [Pseudomonadota bacterium]